MGLSEFWSDKRVVVTGHTGFKGAWLAHWLHKLGADVCGFGLPPETSPSIFNLLDLSQSVRTVYGDIRDGDSVQGMIARERPDVVLHLAAQSLVSRSYEDPVLTWETNVQGTMNLLEALRTLEKPCACVIVTTDKVYLNDDAGVPFGESAPLGGSDPYSASKAATEVLVQSWRRSYFKPDGPLAVATARAGNVIGGGDWATKRLIPDLIRASESRRPLLVRRPDAIRPWQHVLDPLYGYLLLAQALVSQSVAREEIFALNFGPNPEIQATVGEVISIANALLGGPVDVTLQPAAFYEQQELRLDSSRAQEFLNWQPELGLDTSISWTIDWYRTVSDTDSCTSVTSKQIETFESLISEH